MKKLKALVKEPTKKEVRQIAEKKKISLAHKVNVAKPVMKWRNKNKVELIHQIQKAEGNTPCYKTDVSCKDNSCMWFSSCVK